MLKVTQADIGINGYHKWLFTGIEPQGAFSEKRPRHIYFMEDNLLHAISK